LRRGLQAIGTVVCVLVVSTTAAQALRDPTRPPAFASARAATAGKNEVPVWVLQSVLISPERRYAIINGEVVPLGGAIADAELVAINEERVTLRTREGLRILHLFPDVELQGVRPESPTGEKPCQIHRSKVRPEPRNDDSY
jgi:MSHA biogenesis protein MshK